MKKIAFMLVTLAGASLSGYADQVVLMDQNAPSASDESAGLVIPGAAMPLAPKPGAFDITGRKATVAATTYGAKMGQKFRLGLEQQVTIIQDLVAKKSYTQAAGYFMALESSGEEGTGKAISLFARELNADSRFVLLMEMPAGRLMELFLKMKGASYGKGIWYKSLDACVKKQPFKVRQKTRKELEAERKANGGSSLLSLAWNGKDKLLADLPQLTNSDERDLVPTDFFAMYISKCRYEDDAQWEVLIKRYFDFMQLTNETHKEAALDKMALIIEAFEAAWTQENELSEADDAKELSQRLMMTVFTYPVYNYGVNLSERINAFKHDYATDENKAWLAKEGKCVDAQSYCNDVKASVKRTHSGYTCCTLPDEVEVPAYLVQKYIDSTKWQGEASLDNKPTSTLVNLASRLDKGLFVDVLHEWQADPKFVEFLNNNKAVLCPLLMDDKVTMHLDDALAGKAFTACYDEHKDDFMDEFDFDLDAELDALDNDQLLIGS